MIAPLPDARSLGLLRPPAGPPPPPLLHPSPLRPPPPPFPPPPPPPIPDGAHCSLHSRTRRIFRRSLSSPMAHAAVLESSLLAGMRGPPDNPFPVKRAAAAVLAYTAVLMLTPPVTAQWPRQQTLACRATPTATPTWPLRRHERPAASPICRASGTTPASSAFAAGRRRRRPAHRRGDVLEHRGRLQGGPALPALGGGAAQAADGRQQQGQPGCGLPAARPHAVHTHSQPRKMIQTQRPDRHPLRSQRRGAADLPRRPAAPPADAQPWWSGYSRGWWEGDTLVVETTNFRDDGWLDVNGAPLTSDGRSSSASAGRTPAGWKST